MDQVVPDNGVETEVEFGVPLKHEIRQSTAPTKFGSSESN